MFVFFFSSRRRHTRCSRDWSSDVCSSDLVVPVRPLDAVEQQTGKIVIHGDDERTAAVEAEDAVERPPLQDLGQEPGSVLAKGQLVSAGEVEDVGNVVLAQTPFAGLRVERI